MTNTMRIPRGSQQERPIVGPLGHGLHVRGANEDGPTIMAATAQVVDNDGGE
jgi:hypothetical protein